MAGLQRLYYTLRPLRWQQWWYRAWRPLAKRLAAVPAACPLPAVAAAARMPLDWPVRRSYDPATGSFTFLNTTHVFAGRIDWFFAGAGLLWQFNLQYFEWLYDDALTVADRAASIEAFCRDTAPGRSMHPYPTSLRIVSWIRFARRHGGISSSALVRLHQDAVWLGRFPERQLDGNHLFENGIALVTAGAYLRDSRILGSGARILRDCLRRQLCSDGAHCEGSPMYHSLLLWRLLQCIEVLRDMPEREAFTAALEQAAARMLGWLQAITFSDGSWPAVNDAVEGIAPRPQTLFDAAAALGIRFGESELADSGYRMIRRPDYELFIDVGGIMPSWQPGHAHADTGSFCLHVRGQPLIVDAGCSTYSDSRIRSWQRSTAAHNTPVVDGADSSVMWSRFRVGQRCRVTQLSEAPDNLELSYLTAAGARLSRTFRFEPTGICICDRFPKGSGVILPLHLHPSRGFVDGVIDGRIELRTAGLKCIELEQHSLARDFNILLPAACLLLHAEEEIGTYNIELRI